MSAKQLLLTASLLGLLIPAFPALADEQIEGAVETIAVGDVEDYVNTAENAVILDVRTPAEFQMSHIPEAVNMNVQDESFEQMVADLDRDQPYIVHCTKNPVDGRSAAALTKLQAMGFTNLISMEGGWVAWREAELPLVETSSPAN